jgi:dihydrodiol dehydrogenase / D-xylose 1-dehydrogenase (NADP)
MKKSFRWGIIGPGRIAGKFANALFNIPDTCIYAIASRSSKNPEQLKHTFKAEKYYASYEELAVDPNVDAIYVATPNRFHFENVKTCLEVDKAVLCEKPITVNAGQAEELFKLSRSKHVFLMEALWTRFLPIYEQVRQWLEAGEIGDIRLVESTFGVITPRIAEDRFLNAELAGGSLLDLGVYNIALSQWVFQKSPQSITAAGQIGETGVDESVSAILSFGNGAAALFTCSFRAPMLNQIVITGNRGIIIIHPRFVEASRASLSKDGKTRTIQKPLETNGFEFEIKASMRAIRDGALDCPQMTQIDTLDNMRTMDAIRQQIGLQFPFE